MTNLAREEKRTNAAAIKTAYTNTLEKLTALSKASKVGAAAVYDSWIRAAQSPEEKANLYKAKANYLRLFYSRTPCYSPTQYYSPTLPSYLLDLTHKIRRMEADKESIENLYEVTNATYQFLSGQLSQQDYKIFAEAFAKKRNNTFLQIAIGLAVLLLGLVLTLSFTFLPPVIWPFTLAFGVGLLLVARFIPLAFEPNDAFLYVTELARTNMTASPDNTNKRTTTKSVHSLVFFAPVNENGPTQGASPFYQLCSSDKGRDYLAAHWDDLEAHLAEERFFAPVTGNGPAQGSSPFIYLCASYKGCNILETHWDDFKPHLTAERLFAPVTGHGPSQGTNPFYYLCGSDKGREFLSAHWDDFKPHLTTEGLFAPVTGHGPSQGTSPFYYLCSSDKGCDFLAWHWDDFKIHLSRERLFTVVSGKTLFHHLCSSAEGRRLVATHWQDDFSKWVLSSDIEAQLCSVELKKLIKESMLPKVASNAGFFPMATPVSQTSDNRDPRPGC